MISKATFALAAGLVCLVLAGSGCGPACCAASPSAEPKQPETAAQPEPKPAPKPADGTVFVIKLTALGENGTWYMIGDDICEGDAALTELVRSKVEADKKARGNPAGYAFRARLEVTPDTGITAAHIAAAKKAAEAGGATVVEGAAK